jgi:hypothetical protein
MTDINTSEIDEAIEKLGSSISNILQSALTTNDVRMQSLSAIEFQDAGQSGIYGKGLFWRQENSPTKQLVFKPNPDRFYSTEILDLDKNAYLSIGNNKVLSVTELGASVTNSHLTTVGTLKGLKTSGDLSIDDEIFYSADTGRLGLGTDAPNGLLSIATLDGEFIIDSEDSSTKLGNWTNTDLRIVTDDTTRLTIKANGNVVLGSSESAPTMLTVHGKVGVGVNNVSNDVSFATAGPVKFENRKFQVGSSAPSNGSYRLGDTVWNSEPKPSGYVGWVCIKEGTPGEWAPFGRIG